jgi:hypothetical protein
MGAMSVDDLDLASGFQAALPAYVALIRRVMSAGMPSEAFQQDAARIAQERGISEVDSVLLCMLASLRVAEEEGMNPKVRERLAAAYLDRIGEAVRSISG